MNRVQSSSTTMSLRPQAVDFDLTWTQISDTANKVIVLEPVPKPEWNDRFHDVYKLCVAFPEPLSERVYNETRKLLERHIKKLYDDVSQRDGAELLIDYFSKWSTFKQGIGYLSTLYIYLNSQYIRKYRFSAADVEFGENSDNQLMEISELGAYLWKMNMITPLKDKLVKLLIAAIDDDRRGKQQSTQAIYNVISSFIFVENFRAKHKHKFYQEIFEQPFITATMEFYKSEAVLLLEKYDCSSYMEQVLHRLDVERKRLNEYLPLKESHKRVIEACEKCMVGEYLGFLNHECRTMVLNENTKDLRNMFKLLKPLGSGLKALLDQIKAHIKEKGLEKITNLNTSTKMDDNYVQSFVEDLLEVHQKYLKLITDVFEKDKNFIQSLDEAFTDVVNYRESNKTPCRSPEILARFFDNMLKKTTKCHQESEMEDLMNKAVDLFKYITDKDVFQKFYSKMLAKRLIYSQYISLDAEETMINKLKVACGYEFTSKLHRMFTDIKVSDDLGTQFLIKMKEENVDLNLNFSVYILQACAWPLNIAAVFNCVLPPICENAQQRFENYYNHKFNGRKLTWLNHLSNAEVKFLFTKKVYTVVMTTYHVSIIQLFETKDVLTCEDIQKQTNLNDEQLQRHLHSFVDTRLILPLDKNNEPLDRASALSLVTYDKDMYFKLNFGFANKRQKFKLTLSVQKEPTQAMKEAEQTHASVEEDRKLFLQASIVRIMKSRKRERHNLLIDEVINQAKSRFTPQIGMIKKAIESLIEKQYIERSANNEEYQYIA